MGAKVLIFKVESHNNRLKELKVKLKVSNTPEFKLIMQLIRTKGM